VQSDLIVHPNDLKAVSPTEFYVGNDHGVFADVQIASLVFDFLRLPLSYLTHCRQANGKFKCTAAASNILMVNGVNMAPDGKTLYLTACTDGLLKIYDRNEKSGALTHRKDVFVGGAADNIDIAPDGTMYIATHPNVLQFLNGMSDMSGKLSKCSPQPLPNHLFQVKPNRHSPLFS